MADSWGNIQFDARGQLVDVTQRAEPGPPPDMTWTQLELWALVEGKVFGKVVTVSDHRGVDSHLSVAASEIFTDDAGSWVRLVSYDAFCAWGRIPSAERPSTPAPARAVPAKTVWVLHQKPADR